MDGAKQRGMDYADLWEWGKNKGKCVLKYQEGRGVVMTILWELPMKSDKKKLLRDWSCCCRGSVIPELMHFISEGSNNWWAKTNKKQSAKW